MHRLQEESPANHRLEPYRPLSLFMGCDVAPACLDQRSLRRPLDEVGIRAVGLPPLHNSYQRIDRLKLVGLVVRRKFDRLPDDLSLRRRQVEFDLSDKVVVHVHDDDFLFFWFDRSIFHYTGREFATV